MVEKNTNGTLASSIVFENLEAFTRLKVQEFLQGILEEEVTELLGRRRSERRADVDPAPGYRNGHGKPRRFSMQAGTVTVRRPRVRGLEARFVSRILPLFRRRTREVTELLPELYLHGLAQGDFDLALRGLLGNGAPLSASSIQRLREKWVGEYEEWRNRPLEGREIVYLWADGIFVKAGLEDQKAALLVVVGGLRDGRKVILAVVSGFRESKESWGQVLRDLRRRGLPVPRLVVADGHLGIWGALAEVFPESEEQRCWNHRIVNVLDRLPRKLQGQAKALLCRIPYAETRAEAERLRDRFAQRYGKAHPRAVETLRRDWERMVTFYRFPKEHWKHLRTTNPVESPFAAVRLRTAAGKRYKRVENATALIWKVLLVAESAFRKLDHPELLPEVAEGARYQDGIRVTRSTTEAAA
ncbi:MAG: IS256 family transposase [Candidatus Methylomirabilales bacterium]